MSREAREANPRGNKEERACLSVFFAPMTIRLAERPVKRLAQRLTATVAAKLSRLTTCNAMARHGVAVAAACSVLLMTSTGKLAPQAFARSQRDADDTSSTDQRPQSPIVGQIGFASAMQLVRKSDVQERLRGVQRIGAMNDFRGVQLLVQEFRDTPELANDPRVRIESVRVMAPFASRPAVTDLLVKWTKGLTSAPLPEFTPQHESLEALARKQAAMALAASQATAAVRELVTLITADQAAEHPSSQWAFDALRAHPPRELEPLLTKKALKNTEIVRLLGEMGDLRAMEDLRELLAHADIDVQVAAAEALAKLGDATGAAKAREWILRDGASESLRTGAARVLARTRHELAPRAIAMLLADPVTRNEGLLLAETAPTPQLTPSLAALSSLMSGVDRTRVLMALCRGGGALAVKTIASIVKQNPNNFEVLYALAHCQHDSASELLSSMLQSDATKKMAARASLVRLGQHAKPVQGLDKALRELAKSRDNSERYVGIYGLAHTGHTPPSSDHSSDKIDPIATSAICAAGLGWWPYASVDQVNQCTNGLFQGDFNEPNPFIRNAVAAAMYSERSFDRLSTTQIYRWAQSKDASAPVFARLAGMRDNASFRPQLRQLLGSSRFGNNLIRSQVLIGLASSHLASSTALAIEAYRFEPNAMVRGAAIIALSNRDSEVVRNVLQQAATLDPDERVRFYASQILSKGQRAKRFSLPPGGNRMMWVQIKSVANAAAKPTASDAESTTAIAAAATPSTTSATPIAVGLLFSNGFASVAVAPPDGHLLIAGVSSGDVQVQVDASTLGSPTSAIGRNTSERPAKTETPR